MFTLVVPVQAELPTLLGASREDTAWVVTATLLAAAIFTPIAGRLGDMYGKRRIVLLLLALLVVGSVIAAVSTSLFGVVIGRTLQGAVAGVVPLGIAILRDVLPTGRLPSAVALVSATVGVGAALGLAVGALVTAHADWHVLFWLTAGLGVACFGLVLWIVPVSVLRSPGGFDIAGAIGLALGLTGILVAISRGDQWGWLSPATVGLGLGGLVTLLVWGWYELRIPEPLLDLRVAGRRPVLLTNLASIGIGFALFSSNIIFPQILELPIQSGAGFGLSRFAASLIVMPAGLVMIVVAPLSGRLSRVMGPRILLIMGAITLMTAYGFVLVAGNEVWHILASNLLIGIGIGFAFAAMPLLIMQSVPQSETGASNGLNALFRSLGTTAAAAVMGAVLAASSTVEGGAQIPTAAGFQLTYLLAGGGAALALALALLIPVHQPLGENHLALPR